jgi:hypothetical protein
MPTAGDFKQAANLNAIIAGGQIGSTTEAAVYTVPASSQVKVATFSLCNTSASAVTVSVGVVPSGGTVGDGTHRILNSYALAANDTISQEDVIAAVKGALLPTGAMIAVAASATGAIDWVLTGAVSS